MTRSLVQTGEVPFRQGGFTTLELMVVVAIIGVLAALGLPNFGIWKSRTDLKQAVTTVQNELLLGRMAAITRNVPVNVAISVNSTLLTVAITNANTLAVISSSTHRIPQINSLFMQSGVGPPPVFTATPTVNVLFNSMGFRVGGNIPPSENQVLAISNDRGTQYAVRVTLRGGVSWCPTAFCQGTH